MMVLVAKPPSPPFHTGQSPYVQERSFRHKTPHSPADYGVPASVSVVGAGPAGLALAADLATRRIDVLVYAHPTHSRHARRVIEDGHLKFSGVIEGNVHPRCSFHMGDVVAFSKIIILAVPSTGQETILEELRKFDLREHTIIAIPGNLFALVAEAAGIDIGNVIELNLSPYSCRISDSGELLIMGKKRLLYVAASEKCLSPILRSDVESIFLGTKLKWCNNIMEVCLANVNGIFHPLMMLMNTGRIEDTGGDFFLYHDGLTRSVATAMEALDKVRIDSGKALGFEMKTAIGTSNECYSHAFTDLVELAQSSGPHRYLKAPADMSNRNISEDVPDVLVAWLDLAEKLGVDSAPMQAVVVLAEMSTGTAFRQNGRSFANLGLKSLTRSDLMDRFGAH